MTETQTKFGEWSASDAVQPLSQIALTGLLMGGLGRGGIELYRYLTTPPDIRDTPATHGPRYLRTPADIAEDVKEREAEQQGQMLDTQFLVPEEEKTAGAEAGAKWPWEPGGSWNPSTIPGVNTLVAGLDPYRWAGRYANNLEEAPWYKPTAIGALTLGGGLGYMGIKKLVQRLRQAKLEDELLNAKHDYEKALSEPGISKVGEYIDEQYKLWKQGEPKQYGVPAVAPDPPAAGKGPMSNSIANAIAALVLGVTGLGAASGAYWGFDKGKQTSDEALMRQIMKDKMQRARMRGQTPFQAISDEDTDAEQLAGSRGFKGRILT